MKKAKNSLDVAIVGGGPAGSTTGAILKRHRPSYKGGRIERIRTFERDGKVLPCIGLYGIVLDAIQAERSLKGILVHVVNRTQGSRDPLPFVFQILEVWLADGWIEGFEDPKYPAFARMISDESGVIHKNSDISIPNSQTDS